MNIYFLKNFERNIGYEEIILKKHVQKSKLKNYWFKN